jgi:hypothetical protein
MTWEEDDRVIEDYLRKWQAKQVAVEPTQWAASYFGDRWKTLTISCLKPGCVGCNGLHIVDNLK